MESSTILRNEKETHLLESSFEKLEEASGVNLASSAREQGAFVRGREIQCVQDLLRMNLIYGVKNLSYTEMAEWALLQGIGDLSGVAVRQRLRNCEAWLRWLIGQILEQRCGKLKDLPGWQVRLQDATVISRPGSHGTDARLHLQLDLGQMCVSGVDLTDAKGGENLERFEAHPQEIRVADRGYAFARGMGPILRDGYLVVRTNWQSLPWLNAAGERFDLCAWLRQLSQAAETTVFVDTPQGRYPVRLLAAPLAPDKAEAARRRARQAARKKHYQVSENTLLAAGFLLLLTNLPDELWGRELVFWLYRLRWQIELQFKRYKSLLCLDQVRALDPTMLQVQLLCKILAVLLLDALTLQVRLQQPDWFTDPHRPLSFWRLTQLLWAGLQQLICGVFSLARFFACLPALDRHLRSAPRKRQNQLAWAMAALERSDPSFSFFGF